MKRKFVGCGYLCALALTVSVSAQQAPATQAAASSSVAGSGGGVTLEGCVVKEADVPGRRPDELDRSRVLAEDNYVLVNTDVKQGTAPAEAPGPLMYKIRNLKKGELHKLVGHRVQIDGMLDKVGRAKNPVSFAHDLVEIKGTTLRSVGDDCVVK